MSGRALALGAGVAGLAALAIARIARAKPEFACIYKDGFTAEAWQQMLEHYHVAHPCSPFALRCPTEAPPPGEGVHLRLRCPWLGE